MYSYEELPHTDTIISFSLNIEKSVVFKISSKARVMKEVTLKDKD